MHLLVLAFIFGEFGKASFDYGQVVATLAAMASNFQLNNEITYRSYR